MKFQNFVFLCFLGILLLGCSSNPTTQLRTLSDDLASGTATYFPQLSPETSVELMPIPDATWRKNAQTWATKLAADAARIDAKKLTPDQRTALSALFTRSNEAAKMVQLLPKDAAAYNIASWLRSMAVGKNSEKRINEAMKSAPEYYLAAADALTSLDPTSISKMVAEHQVLFAVLDKHPSAETQQARLAAKNYIAYCISKRSLALLNTQPAK